MVTEEQLLRLEKRLDALEAENADLKLAVDEAAESFISLQADGLATSGDFDPAPLPVSVPQDRKIALTPASDNPGFLGEDNTEGKVRVDGVGLLTKTKGGASPDEHIVIGHAVDAHDGRYPPIGDGSGDGDISYWDGDSWEILPAGTPPCVLVIDSAGLRWQTIDAAYKGIFRTSGGDIDDDWVRAKA